jgi:hypothetical protein
VLHIPQNVHAAAPRHVDVQHQHGNLGFPQAAQYLIAVTSFGKVGAGQNIGKDLS